MMCDGRRTRPASASSSRPRQGRDCCRRPLPLSAVALLLASVWSAPHAAPISEEDELALAYGDKPFVSIATGSRQPLSRAPAVATVITAEDIAAIGATDLDDVLETVPGLHVARSTQTYTPVYAIRGINLGFNPQVLMLVNGIPVTAVYTGNRGNVWGGMPVSNIQRVEVIRGPGSALYGADAFAGVINVITKTSADLNGTQMGVRAGSFETRDAWLLHGGTWGPFQVAGYLRHGTTQGARPTVQADAQTGWDAVFGTAASHAPGPIDLQRDAIDAAIDLSLDRWRWRAGYKERKGVGSGTGVASALDPTGRNYSQNISTDLSYDDPQFAPDWALSVQASFMHYKEFSDLVLYPAGAFGGAFTDGMIGNPDKWERHTRLSASAVYTGFASHRVRLGLGTEQEDVYKTRESKNFDAATFAPLGTGSFADVTDVSQSAPFMRPQGREKHYAYVQDEWRMAQDWTLTAGLRHDRYSDFGSTTNPRAALVWDAAYNVTAKLMLGTAFRAPSMSELYAINNPVVQGNPDLKPEKIHTLEAAVSWQPAPRLHLAATAFRYRMADIIRLVESVYENSGTQTGHGLELEARWEPVDELRLTGNYSHQRSRDQASGADAGNAPRHHVYLRADWHVGADWWLHPQLNWVSKRYRVANDPRPPLAGYETVDLTLRTASGDTRPWSLALSVRNLFDRHAREPSPYDQAGPAGNTFISLPHDIPLPGRSLYVQATYRF